MNPIFKRDVIVNYPTSVEKPTNINSTWKPAITITSNIWENVDYVNELIFINN